jgi:alanyl-tRNA synthetase
LANEAVLANMAVETTWLPRNEAEARYGFRLYQGGAVPGKEIRVVKTGSWDVEACAGTHLKNTGEIGYVKILHTERVQDGVERLVYAVGMQAVKKVQQQETLLWKVAETLNAPLDKLDKTAEHIVKELKEANTEKKKLLKELTTKEGSLIAKPEGEMRPDFIIKTGSGKEIMVEVKVFPGTDIERMVQTGSAIIKRNDGTITVFGGSNDKTSNIVIMSGSIPVNEGFNAGSIIREIAPIIGGGGGGRPNFAQGGGPKPEKLQDAVKAAGEAIKKQLKP